MAARCRTFDWAASPIGPVAEWSPDLRTAVRLMLSSPVATSLWCGPSYTLLYNDAYAPILGAKHPDALGRSGAAVWDELWPSLEPQFSQVRSGGPPVFADEALFRMERLDGGRAEDAWFTYALSALTDESGACLAVYNVAIEVTERARAERARAVERTRLMEVFRQSPSFLAVLRGPDDVFELANDAYYQFIGPREIIGKPLFEALPETRGQGFEANHRRVRETGEPLVIHDLRVMIQRTPGAPPEERFMDVTYLPLVEPDGSRAAVIAHGADVTEQVRARREVERLLAESEAAREAAEVTNTLLQEQQLELELTNQQLQDQATELEMQTEELEATTEELAERTGAAEAAERQLQTVFAQAPAPVAVTRGADHRFVLVNARYEALVGRRVGAGQTFREALPELATQGFESLLDRVYTTGEPYVARESRAWLEKEHGRSEEGWYDFVYQPLLDAAGRVTGIMQLGVEVTAQVRAREAVARSERQLRTLVDAIPTLAWTARADGYIDWYNARWYEYTGTTPEQMAGWGWQSVHDPAVLPAVLERWAASIATGEPFEMTFPLRGADGRFRPFLTRCSPVRETDGRVLRWFGTNTDVEVERAAREAAEHANKAKTDFLATMSHELRTPLNAIAGYADLMELGLHGPVTEAQRMALGKIQRSQRHLLGLINDVLNFAKLEAGRVEYDLADVSVCDVANALEPLVGPQLRAKALRFDREQCRGTCVAHADPEKLRQILVNLLSNAIKFTAAGGAVALRCRAEGPVVSVVVEDTGIGIAADRLEHVFAPFVQIDRGLNSPLEGTGLGLAISRDLARGMKGDLTAESAPGVGSRFTLTLPRARPRGNR